MNRTKGEAITKNKFKKNEPNLALEKWIGETSQIGAWVWYPESNENWWSQAIYEIYEISPDNIENVDLMSFYDAENLEKLTTAVGNAINFNTPWDFELKISLPDGREKWIQSSGQCSEVETGNNVILGSCQDITRYKKLTEEVQTKSQFLESILYNIPDLVFVKEAKDLRFILFNKATEALLGVKNSDIIGKNDHDLFSQSQADFFVANDREVLGNGKHLKIVEEQIETPNGTKLLKTKKIPLLGPDGKPTFLLGISEDITESTRQQKLIAEQNKTLESQSRLSALGQMAAGIAHEINNPLAIIMGISLRMERELEKDEIDTKALNDLRIKIGKTTERIASIISGLKDFSRDGGKDPLELVQINTLVTDALSFCQTGIENSGIEISVAHSTDDQMVYCQQIRFSQVLLNLINNARDAVADLPNGKIHIEITRTEDNKTQVSVSDNGPGVAEEIQDKIHDPFFTTKEVGKGMGLGLSISRGIIEAQNGELWLDKEFKNGARFVITLPASAQRSFAA